MFELHTNRSRQSEFDCLGSMHQSWHTIYIRGLIGRVYQLSFDEDTSTGTCADDSDRKDGRLPRLSIENLTQHGIHYLEVLRDDRQCSIRRRRIQGTSHTGTVQNMFAGW